MSVKLYRHENGQTVGAALHVPSQEYGIVHSNGYLEHIGKERFLKTYTPLPEAPDVGSTAWAWQMLENGEKVCNSGFGNDSTTGILYIYADGGAIFDDKGNNFNISFFCGLNEKCWQLYEAPKPIVECLPHEFVQGQEVLVRGKGDDDNVWIKTTFFEYQHERDYRFGTTNANTVFSKLYWPYCIPYAENSHLEGQITDGEHGAVPKGYVPPHVPKLGEADYWCVGDEVVNLVRGDVNIIVEISKNKIHLDNGIWYDITADFKAPKLRTLYHKGSYVRENGTVHEHIPTRPHRIETCTTCDGTDDVESCAYCKDKG